jgi:hypothetical protein
LLFKKLFHKVGFRDRRESKDSTNYLYVNLLHNPTTFLIVY